MTDRFYLVPKPNSKSTLKQKIERINQRFKYWTLLHPKKAKIISVILLLLVLGEISVHYDVNIRYSNQSEPDLTILPVKHSVTKQTRNKLIKIIEHNRFSSGKIIIATHSQLLDNPYQNGMYKPNKQGQYESVAPDTELKPYIVSSHFGTHSEPGVLATSVFNDNNQTFTSTTIDKIDSNTPLTMLDKSPHARHEQWISKNTCYYRNVNWRPFYFENILTMPWRGFYKTKINNAYKIAKKSTLDYLFLNDADFSNAYQVNNDLDVVNYTVQGMGRGQVFVNMQNKTVQYVYLETDKSGQYHDYSTVSYYNDVKHLHVPIYIRVLYHVSGPDKDQEEPDNILNTQNMYSESLDDITSTSPYAQSNNDDSDGDTYNPNNPNEQY